MNLMVLLWLLVGTLLILQSHLLDQAPAKGLALPFADWMQDLHYSSDVKSRNWVGVSNICAPSST